MSGTANIVVVALLIAIGGLNVLPGVVLFAPGRAADLYGLELTTDTLAVVMRHRAALLALVGVALLYAAAEPSARWPAMVAAVASKLVFLGLYSGAAAPALRKIAIADAAALAGLAVAAALMVFAGASAGAAKAS